MQNISQSQVQPKFGHESISAPQTGQVFYSTDHELICLAYEEALKWGYEVDYGHWPEGGYYVEIYACTLSDLSAILKGAEEQRNRDSQQLALWDGGEEVRRD